MPALSPAPDMTDEQAEVKENVEYDDEIERILAQSDKESDDRKSDDWIPSHTTYFASYFTHTAHLQPASDSSHSIPFHPFSFRRHHPYVTEREKYAAYAHEKLKWDTKRLRKLLRGKMYQSVSIMFRHLPFRNENLGTSSKHVLGRIVAVTK